MPEALKYWAFISYSHQDRAWGEWLHKALESYRIPSRLVGRGSRDGQIPKRLFPIFRDREELSSSAELGSAINAALEASRYQIVVCSPRSAASKWVNEEVKYFKSLGRGDRVLCLIVDGKPNETSSAEGESRECFCPALRFHVTPERQLTDEAAEPLAADARDHADGKSDAKLKLIAGLIGVGFDELRQREARRRHRLMTMAVMASMGIAAAMSVLALDAYRARNEAEAKRLQADDLIGFMLGDLKDHLYAVGQIEALDSTVTKAMGYLGVGDGAAPENANLIQRSRALSNVSTIRFMRGDQEGAKQAGQDALATAREAQKQLPGPESDEALARAVHALGEPALEGGEFAPMTPLVEEAREIASRLRRASLDDRDLALLQASLEDHIFYINAAGPNGSLAKAEKAERECMDLLKPIASQGDAEAKFERFRLRCQFQRAVLLMEPGANAIASAPDAFAELLEEGESAEQRFPKDQQLKLLLQASYSNAAGLFAREGAADKAWQASQKAVAIGQRLIALEPDNMEWLKQLGIAQVFAASITSNMARVEDALRASTDALSTFDELLQRNPKDEFARSVAMSVRLLRARTLAAHNDEPAALAEVASGLALSADGTTKRLLLFELNLRLEQWKLYQRMRREVPREARESAYRRLQQLKDVDGALFAAYGARMDYLDGNFDHGDQQLAAIKDEQQLKELSEYRQQICADREKSRQKPCAHP